MDFQKKNPGTDQQKFKVRLVVKGFTQREENNYNDVFSPHEKHISLRMLLAIVIKFNLELHYIATICKRYFDSKQ